MKKGISLILVVILIIIVIIIGVVIFLNLNSKSVDNTAKNEIPLEAIVEGETYIQNEYTDDIDKVQMALDIFFNSLMTETNKVVTVTPGTLTDTARWSFGTTVDQKFEFNKGNTSVKMDLPVYNKGEVWSITTEGKVKLEVGGINMN